MTLSSGIILLTPEDNQVVITRFQEDRLQVIPRFSIVTKRSTMLAQNLTAV
jgi:hypothetical protein